MDEQVDEIERAIFNRDYGDMALEDLVSWHGQFKVHMLANRTMVFDGLYELTQIELDDA